MGPFSENNFAADLALEIVYGCNRFDKADIKPLVLDIADLEEFRKLVYEKCIELDPPCQGLEDDGDSHRKFYEESIKRWTTF